MAIYTGNNFGGFTSESFGGFEGVSSGASQNNINNPASSGSSFDGLSLLSSVTSGLDDFGQGMGLFAKADQLQASAEFDNIQANALRYQGEYTQKQILRKGKKVTGSQSAGYAKSGVTLSGSPLSVMAESMKNYRQDALMSRLNKLSQANALSFSGIQKKIASGSARSAGYSKIGQGVVNMVSSYAMMA